MARSVDGDDEFFLGYEETTVDPGWSFIAGVTIAYLLLNLLLPCLVTLGSRYETRRIAHKRRKNGTGQGRIDGSNPNSNDSDEEVGAVTSDKNGRAGDKVVFVDMKKVHPSSDDCDDSLRAPSQSRLKQGRSDPPSGNASLTSLARRNALENAGEWVLTLADKIMIPPYPDDDRRSQSYQPRPQQHSSAASIASIATGSSLSGALLLSSRPRRGGSKASRAVLDQLECSSSSRSSSNLKVRGTCGSSEAARASAEDGVLRPNNAPVKLPSSLRSGLRPAAHDDALSMRFGHQRGGKFPASSSNRGGSALSRLDHDDVSFHDAIDDYAQGRYLLPTGEGAGEVDLCCGEHAWWKPSMILGGFDRLVGTAEWDEEVTEIMKLTVPYSIQSLMFGVFGVISLALLGHLVGTTEANAYIIVTLLFGITNTLNYGFYESLGTLLPHAIGTEDLKLGGTYLNTAMVLYTVGSIPTSLFWALGVTRTATLWFGFDETTADIAQQYCYSYIILEWLRGLKSCLSTFLSVSGHERYSTVMQFVDHILSTLAFLIPPLIGRAGLSSIGVAQVAFEVLSFLANIIISSSSGLFVGYWEGFATMPFKNITALKTVLKTAAPLGIAWLLTYGEWELLTFFASHLGPAEVAAWGYMGYIWSMLEYFSDGIADGSEVRCSYHLGANNPEFARLSSYKSTYLGFLTSVCATAILFLLSENLVRWITPDPTVQRLMLELFPLIGIGQIALTTGIMSWALVGSQGRYKLATTVQFVGSWGLTLPLSALFACILNINLQGLAAALVLGYTLAGTGNTYILLRSQWARLAAKIAAENALNDEVSTDELGSEDVPDKAESVQSAVLVNCEKSAKPKNLLGKDNVSEFGDEDSLLGNFKPNISSISHGSTSQ